MMSITLPGVARPIVVAPLKAFYDVTKTTVFPLFFLSIMEGVGRLSRKRK
jgi:hypothetical protein